MNEEKLLETLRKTDEFLSGEQISNIFKVSRTAVWKAIVKLKTKGFKIESVTGKGYKLIYSPDVIFPGELMNIRTTKRIGRRVVYFDQCSSTNDKARQGATAGDEAGSVYITDLQFQGRGRLGRTWHSEAGKGIAMSILLRPSVPISGVMPLSLIAGLSVSNALKIECGLECQLKWPNDILCHGKKLAGVLIEASTCGEMIDYLVIGIGVNCNTNIFSEDLKDKATSVLLELGAPCHRKNVIGRILEEFEQLYLEWVRDYEVNTERPLLDYSPLYLKQYKDGCVNLGQPVVIHTSSTKISGIAIDILPSGNLLVETSDGSVIRVSAGEVSLSGPTTGESNEIHV